MEVRPIDANRFIKYLTAKKKVCEEFNDWTGVVRYQVAIDETKKTDTLRNYEPVVHCRNCKHRNKEYSETFCEVLGRLTNDNFYCRYGAKMDEEQK